MEQIYKVTKIAKKGKKFVITFDNYDNEVILNEDKLVEYRILLNNEYSKSEFNKIIKSEKEVRYYELVVNYINFKQRTKNEVVKYLEDHDANKTQIDSIIKKLTYISYIDDNRYTNSFISEYIRKKKGKKYIYQTLENKGVDKKIIDEYIDKYTSDLEYDNAMSVANKVASLNTKNPIKKQKLQISNKLLTDGYSYDIINKVLSNVDLTDESFETLEKEYHKLLLKELDKNKIIQKLLAKGFEYSSIRQIMSDYDE